MSGDEPDLYQWAAKHYGKTPFGITWPKDTFYGAGLDIRITITRLYVVAVYRPLIRPLIRRLAHR